MTVTTNPARRTNAPISRLVFKQDLLDDAHPPAEQRRPQDRPTLSPMGADRARLVTSLDLRAKIRLLTGASVFALAPEPAIALGELRMSDGPTGVRGPRFAGRPVLALLPNATLLASTWSEQVAEEAGRLPAEEAMAQEIHVVLGPTINLHRSPLGGRLFEAYSEDPLLTGKIAAAYVRGIQSAGVGACLKHLVANESETD